MKKNSDWYKNAAAKLNGFTRESKIVRHQRIMNRIPDSYNYHLNKINSTTFYREIYNYPIQR